MLDPRSQVYMLRLYAYVRDALPGPKIPLEQFSQSAELREESGLVLLNQARDAQQKSWAMECALGRPLGYREKNHVVRLHLNHEPAEKFYEMFRIEIPVTQVPAVQPYSNGRVTKPSRATLRIEPNRSHPRTKTKPWESDIVDYTITLRPGPYRVIFANTLLPEQTLAALQTIDIAVDGTLPPPEPNDAPAKRLAPRNGTHASLNGAHDFYLGFSKGKDYDKDRPYKVLIKKLDEFAKAQGRGGIEKVVRDYIQGSETHKKKILAGLHFPENGAMIFSKVLNVPRHKLEAELRFHH